MNIKILDSWLREHVKTSATPQQLAEKLSLSSVSIEKIVPTVIAVRDPDKIGERLKNDLVYDIEITTNRPELMSIIGLAREAAAVLNQNGIHATFTPPVILNEVKNQNDVEIKIKNDPKLVNRVCAVVMEVEVKPSPKVIQDRLDSTDIRSLNNIIDITNYVMRVIGHPTHVMDFDKLTGQSLTIRESKKGEKIKTLDNKEYTLSGGDIVAVDGKGNIVDLPGVMGLQNSVVSDNTKRILFFVNNDEPNHVRKTSMTQGIRTEAAVLNEKGIDPELAMDALLYGISLYIKLADAKIISKITDIYPNKIKKQTITVSEQHINSIIGVKIPLQKSATILTGLGFETKIDGEKLTVTPPSFRAKDIEIPEDVIEEIARIYGYHNIPNKLPTITSINSTPKETDEFYWENRIKDALKYWGFTETYTYPMVSEEMYEGPVENAVTIQNPLSEEFTHMRMTLVPSLLKVVSENKGKEIIKIFEISNVYTKKNNNLPEQKIKLAGVSKKPKNSFYEMKGLIEQLLNDLGIVNIIWKPSENGASIFLSQTDHLGDIEILDQNLLNFELDFLLLLKHATLKKKYKPASKYPPIVEDLALVAPESVTVGEITEFISKQSPLITEVSLLDKYKDTRTFHIVYQSYQKNLTNEGVGEIREKILKALKEKYNANLKA